MDRNLLIGGACAAAILGVIYVFGLQDSRDSAFHSEVTVTAPAVVAPSAQVRTSSSSADPSATAPATSVRKRTVGCEITLFGYDALTSRCGFEPLGNGSFRLTSAEGDELSFPNVAFALDDPQNVEVTLTGVSALGEAQWDGASGRTEILGPLYRSHSDDACWEGGDADGRHRICAR